MGNRNEITSLKGVRRRPSLLLRNERNTSAPAIGIKEQALLAVIAATFEGTKSPQSDADLQAVKVDDPDKLEKIRALPMVPTLTVGSRLSEGFTVADKQEEQNMEIIRRTLKAYGIVAGDVALHSPEPGKIVLDMPNAVNIGKVEKFLLEKSRGELPGSIAHRELEALRIAQQNARC